MNKGKFLIVSLIAVVVFFGVVYAGISLTSNLGKSKKQITAENAEAQLDKMYSKIDVTKGKPAKGQIDLNPADLAEELPDINKFPVTVENSTESFVEIFSSPEKTGKGNDSWLNEVAKDYNAAKLQVDGKVVSVKIRSIASGTATDYIKSGKYVPDAFTPSNEFWGEMVKDSGVTAELISKRMVGNVPGLVIKKKKYDQLVDKYGSVNVKTVTDAMAKNDFAMGYTDPFASSTGLNLLLTALNTFDKSNLLGEKAVQGFEQFQSNVPFTASTTLQMREAAKSGALDGFVLEYQTFINSPDLKDSYVFTPFGVRHDSPLYAIGNISDEKKQIIQQFAQFSQEKKYQELGKKYGFNGLDSYAPEMQTVDGATLSAAQKLWKDKKNANKPIVAVFVADVSGSMNGEPMNRMKESLLKGQKYLGKNNSIGLVTYSDDVEINLPIAPFDTNQQSYFVGAVEGLQANGGTATYDGIVVAMKLLKDEMKMNPDVTPLIFVLSDGETNRGHSLDDIRGLIQAYKVPIYTIGYNANLKALQTISSINEAASINADSDDVVYKIKNLFNVQL
ncbi:VWA domain-containing protein [Bacillus sp. FJAT-27445]|uniref:vWA domain-containing protein n=1 Tax=Bacillus sp. FJAT-27445 TaxID=1679166 RepID=UPI000743BB34|nr:vWA domain-containing protein [Bacillus sp. FJAT-27445]